MDLETIKKMIKKYEPGHTRMVQQTMQAERYYRNETDILVQNQNRETDQENPLRNADNRIPRNFHGLIVNQKAAYMFTSPPLFDIGNEQGNEVITDALGDEYRKNCMELCVNAANAAVGWIHYWEDNGGTFQWAVVDSKQIIPIVSCDLKTESVAKTSQIIKLFMSPEIEIKPGAKITVTQAGVTETYECSGTPAVYETHQEIILKLAERYA